LVGNYQNPVQTRPILFYYWHSNHYTLHTTYILFCTRKHITTHQHPPALLYLSSQVHIVTNRIESNRIEQNKKANRMKSQIKQREVKRERERHVPFFFFILWIQADDDDFVCLFGGIDRVILCFHIISYFKTTRHNTIAEENKILYVT
jgi:hypothetical protein